jgi:acyl carrier protein
MTFANLYHICPQDRLGNFGPSSIGKQLYYALLSGAMQYPVPHQAEGLLHIGNWLIEEGITIFISLPTAFRHLINTAPKDERFPNLRVIRLCGEPLIKRDVESYQQQFSSGCVLVNMYASKETGTVSQYLIDKNTIVASSRVPVGYPEEGIKLFVVDDLAHEVPFDQLGEIVVQSRFLSSGYWQGNTQTPKPIHLKTVEGAEHLYFTGDIGRLSKDGLLEHLGRKDSMVKIRSFRVDIGEVEAKLSEHPGVKEAAVIAKENLFGETTLIAYFVPYGNPSPTVTSLRSFLQKELPDYMIPTTFVALTKFSLLATGKVNRRALPDPGRSRPELATDYAAPRTPIEQQLAKVWGEILSLNQIGIHDDFFELGGHSLAATRVVSQVIKQFQLQIPLRSLFDSPTVAEMAAVITEHQGKQLGGIELEQLLSELESMSDEEAQRMLVEESARTPTGDGHE